MTCALADILPRNESALVSEVLVAERNFVVLDWQPSVGCMRMYYKTGDA